LLPSATRYQSGLFVIAESPLSMNIQLSIDLRLPKLGEIIPEKLELGISSERSIMAMEICLRLGSGQFHAFLQQKLEFFAEFLRSLVLCLTISVGAICRSQIFDTQAETL
jgi:hypothetical protein